MTEFFMVPLCFSSNDIFALALALSVQSFIWTCFFFSSDILCLYALCLSALLAYFGGFRPPLKPALSSPVETMPFSKKSLVYNTIGSITKCTRTIAFAHNRNMAGHLVRTHIHHRPNSNSILHPDKHCTGRSFHSSPVLLTGLQRTLHCSTICNNSLLHACCCNGLYGFSRFVFWKL